MAGLGSPVTVLTCDITERAALRALLTRLASSGPRLSAVLHAAVYNTSAVPTSPDEHFAILAFSSLFAVINPISAASIFVTLTPNESRTKPETLRPAPRVRAFAQDNF